MLASFLNPCHLRRSAAQSVTLCAALLAGCTSPTAQLDSRFSRSVAQLTAQQTMYPDAARNTDPVKGVDGQAASAAYEQYQKSFSAPEPQANPFNIGVGSTR